MDPTFLTPPLEIAPATAPLRPGDGHLEVQLVSRQSTATSVRSASPLRMLVPKARGASVWTLTSGLGGGYVAGDQTSLGVQVGTGARCFLGTQASTKVYRNPAGRPCRHELRARVEEEALLVLAPDPVQCFAESIYEQRQQIRLARGSSLVLVDWLTSGRAARGERWAFSGYHSRLEVFSDEQVVFVDSLRLDPRDGPLDEPARMGRFNCVALVLLMGRSLSAAIETLLAETAARPVSRRSDFLCSASPIHDGALLRLAGTSVEQVAHEIRRQLGFVPHLLGDDPWIRKW